MDIFGIGFSELVFIFIIAMMIFGPRRLPEVAGKVGRFIADMRLVYQQYMVEWQRELTIAARLEELELEKTRQGLQEIKQELDQISKEVKAETAAAKAELKTIAPPHTASRPAPQSKASNSASNPPPETQTPPEEKVEIASSSETGAAGEKPTIAVPTKPGGSQLESRSENGTLPQEVVNE
jgi:sec-independent protein translocase protein TatB